MQRQTKIASVPIKIDGDVLSIGLMPDHRSFHRTHAPALIAFLQQWLDHDPEQELRSRVDRLRLIGTSEGGGFQQATNDIIAAVREHDATYRRGDS